jgi:uncharacterized metal-binding protein
VIERTLATARQDGLTPRVMAAAANTPRHPDGAMRTRVEETLLFCREMGWTKIGVAFCLMLAKEANVLCRQLSEAGFTVAPVCCKVGAIGLPDVGVDAPCDEKKGACNPMTQAALLNEQHTDVNIVLGLCIGHDLLFNKYAESPVTTLAVKDRALRHNPIVALRPVAEEHCGGGGH